MLVALRVNLAVAAQVRSFQVVRNKMPIGEIHGLQKDHGLSVLRRVAPDIHVLPQRRLHAVPRHSRIAHVPRRPAFDRPGGHLPARIFHVHIQINVRVDPIDLGHHALQFDRIGAAEFGFKGMVRDGGNSQHKNTENRKQGTTHFARHDYRLSKN